MRDLAVNSKHWTNLEKVKTSSANLSIEAINNKFLKGLPERTRHSIFSLMETIYLDGGEYIYQPEDKSGYLYFLESAVVSEFQILEDGKTVEVAITGNEGVVGITSVFSSQPALNWSQTLISGKARRIGASVFRREITACAHFQEILCDYTNSYIAQISRKVVCGSFHPLEKRLCCWLLTLDDCCGDDLLLTQEQIARSLGVHRPSITLVTQSLREQGIIDYTRGKVRILDRQSLEAAACECYSAVQKYR